MTVSGLGLRNHPLQFSGTDDGTQLRKFSPAITVEDKRVYIVARTSEFGTTNFVRFKGSELSTTDSNETINSNFGLTAYSGGLYGLRKGTTGELEIRKRSSVAGTNQTFYAYKLWERQLVDNIKNQMQKGVTE